jgi:hypothetical protein
VKGPAAAVHVDDQGGGVNRAVARLPQRRLHPRAVDRRDNKEPQTGAGRCLVFGRHVRWTGDECVLDARGALRRRAATRGSAFFLLGHRSALFLEKDGSVFWSFSPRRSAQELSGASGTSRPLSGVGPGRGDDAVGGGDEPR